MLTFVALCYHMWTSVVENFGTVWQSRLETEHWRFPGAKHSGTMVRWQVQDARGGDVTRPLGHIDQAIKVDQATH